MRQGWEKNYTKDKNQKTMARFLATATSFLVVEDEV